MASTLSFLLLIISAFSFHFSNATFVLPIVKDNTKSQYYTSFLVGTRPSTRVYLVVDLSNQWSWFACDLYGYNTNSTTYHEVPCFSPSCEGAFCYGETTCGVYAYTSLVDGFYTGPLVEDVSSLYKQPQQNSLAQLSKVSLPTFPFTCADKGPLKGLSPHTKGVVTLARVPFSLHSQISSTFKVPRKFALCLPSSTTSSGYNGAIYFGGSPNYMSKYLITTPLVINPNSTGHIWYEGQTPAEYFIKVRSIKVDATPLRFRSSLLSFDIKERVGGTKISTMHPYTVLHSDIYKALINVFVTKAAATKMTRVTSVAPFGACFSTKTVVYNAETGPSVPIINIVMDGNSPLLHNKNARWRIYGANSMVKVSESIMCLGFVDGGSSPTTSVVIGGKQMEDNLVEIDLETNNIGVTSSLLRLGTSCSKFKGI